MLSVFLYWDHLSPPPPIPAPPMAPAHCHLQWSETFYDKAKKYTFLNTFFSLLALQFRSKLKQDVNISPFVNHFMLKNPRALDTFNHANQMKMYT